MTAIASPIRSGSSVRSLVLSREFVPVATLVLLLCGLLAAVWGTWGDPGRDTGYDLIAGQRVAHGELPYVDFVYYYGALAPFTVGLVEWAGGGGLAPVVWLGIALTGGIVLATYALARSQVGRVGAFLAAAITAAVAVVPSNLSFVLPHTESETLGVLAVLGVLIALQRVAAGASNRVLVVAGAIGGLVALTRFECELAFLLVLAIWLALRPGSRVREAALIGTPAVLLPAAVYGGFLAVVPAHRLFLQNLYPIDTLRAAGNTVLRIHAPLTASSFAALAGKTLLYGGGLAVMVFAAHCLQRPGRVQNAVRGALIGLTVILTAVAVLRPETLRFWLGYVYAWIPAGAVILLVLALRRRDAATSVFLGALVVLAGTNYGAFLMHAERPQPAVYVAPLAAVFLARVHLVELERARVLGIAWLTFLALAGTGLALKDARAESATIGGPGGSLAVAPAEAGPYRSALSWIESTTRSGDPILLAPQLTVLYTLSDRVDPLPEISLLPGALPRVDDERAAIASLQSANLRLVITDRHVFREYGHTSFGESFDRVLAAWIKLNFNHAATVGGSGQARTLDVWTRRGH